MPAPEPTTPRTDEQPIDDFDDSIIPPALPPLRPVPREESVSAAQATEPTIQQTTATATEPTIQQTSTTTTEPTMMQTSTTTTEPTIQQKEATLTAADIADSMLISKTASSRAACERKTADAYY